MKRRGWRASGLAALLVLAAACSSSGSPVTPGPDGTGPTHAQLVAAANLRPCPASSSTPVPGGLPDVTLPCLGNGPPVRMAGLTGRPTLVNLWGSWCVPCQAEEKYLSSAYDQTRGKVRFLGVDTVDQADSALDFDAHVSPPVHFPSVFDPDKKVLLGLHFTGPPRTVLLDSSGRIVHTRNTPYPSTAAVLTDIATYLRVPT